MLLRNICLVEQKYRGSIVDPKRINESLVNNERVNDAEFELSFGFDESSSQS